METFSGNGWKMVNNLIVEIPKQKKDKITHGTLELHMTENASAHNEFENRVPYGTVVGCPEYKDIKEGDKVWFHHNIVINQTNMMTMAKNKRTVSHKYRIDKDKNWYLAKYSETDLSLNCMVYLVEEKDTKKKKALNIFCFGEPIDKEQLVERNGIIIRNPYDKGFALECRLNYVSEHSETHGFKEGDVVGVLNNADYKMEVDGETMWRFPYYSIGYVIRDGVYIPVNNNVIIKIDEDEDKVGDFELAVSHRDTSDKGEIILAGDKCSELKGGERVIHEKKGLFNLYNKDGVDYYITSESNITAVI